MPKQLSFNWDETPEQLQDSALTSGNSLTTYKHDGQFPRSKGEFCYVKRKFKESGAFSFSGNEKIESIDDVAYIFRELENASVENAFAVLVNRGIPTVIHLGMGTFISTQVNFAAIKAAYNAIGAEKIYFIHNHPSGEVLCSEQDRSALHMIRRMFPPDIVQEGIIINTISGKYGTFDTYGHTNQYERPSSGNNIPLSLHSFDRLVFSPDYNLKNLSVIHNSGDVAALVSAQRLGSTQKISYLILDRGNKVIGNIHTTFQQIADNETSLAEEVADKVILFGGNQAILYGDFDFQGITKLKQEVERISGNTVNLTDVISIEGLHTKSAIDEMVMETTTDYNKEDVRFQDIEQVNRKFNEQLNEFERGKMRPEDFFNLGTPSSVLQSAGISNMPIRMTQKVLRTHIQKHDLEFSDIRKLIPALQNPIIIYKWGSKAKSSIVVTNVATKDRHKVTIAIRIDRNKGNIDVNEIASVHGKDVNRFLRDMVNAKEGGLKDALRYVDKEKALDWLGFRAPSAHTQADQGLDSIANIIENFENPTLLDGEISSAINKGSMIVPPNNADIRFRFIGEKGAANLDRAEETTTRLDNLNVAREMEKAGKDAKAIKYATGWERGADGKWRYELSEGKFDRMGELHPGRRRLTDAEKKELEEAFDETMQAFEKGSVAYNGEITEDTDMADIYEAGGMERKKAQRISELEEKEQRLTKEPKHLDDYLDDEELYKAYPELRDIIIDTNNEGDAVFGKLGAYDPLTNTIKLNYVSHDILVHELQHVIQRKEGFSVGGSPSTVRGNLDGVPYDRNLSNNELYNRLSGEVEARNVQSRLNMTPDERRNSLASETEDVAREDQIFLNDALGVSASMGSSIEDVNRKFNEKLEGLTDENAERIILYCGNPSVSLLRAGIPNRNIALYGNKLLKKAKQHGYDIGAVKNLPSYIQNPIAVFKGSYNGGFAILTEIPINAKNTLVSIDINKGKVQDLNLVTSVFGKNNKGIIDWINSGKLLFENKERVLNYLSSSALIADATNNSELLSATKIVNNFENPLLEDGKIVSAIESLAGDVNEIKNKDKKNFASIDIDLLPEFLRQSYGRYESAWEEAMSMRASGLCHPDDIQEQVHEMKERYKEFSEQLREFLGLEAGNGTFFDEYQHVSFKVEAHNVQPRFDMTPEERYNSLASETENIAREDQIFLNDALGVSASMGSSIEDVNRKFNEKLEGLTEENADSVRFELGNPSSALLSAGIPMKPLVLYGNKLVKKANKHGFNIKDVKDLPNALQSPIGVFVGSHPNSYSILTEMDLRGKKVLVSVETNKDGEVDFNLISSVFGKNDKGVIRWILDGKLRNVDKGKALAYISASAPIADATYKKELDSATNIVKNFENPTLLVGKISSTIDELSSELGVNVNRVQIRKDLPEGIRRQMKGGRYPGLFDPKTGQVYMVMDEITDAADAQATMLHEIVGHKGIRGLFGDRIGEFTSRVLDSIPEAERKNWVDKYKGNEQLAAEEYVARFAEGYENPGIWEKIKAIFRDFLRDLGIDLKLRDNDLKYILWKAKKTLGRENIVPKNKIVLFRKNKNIENPPRRSSNIKQKSVDFQNSI